MDERPSESDERRGDVLGVLALTYFGLTLLTFAATLWGLPGTGGKEGAGRTIALIGAFAFAAAAAIALGHGRFSRLPLHSRAAIVAFGVLPTIPAWIWIFDH